MVVGSSRLALSLLGLWILPSCNSQFIFVEELPARELQLQDVVEPAPSRMERIGKMFGRSSSWSYTSTSWTRGADGEMHKEVHRESRESYNDGKQQHEKSSTKDCHDGDCHQETVVSHTDNPAENFSSNFGMEVPSARLRPMPPMLRGSGLGLLHPHMVRPSVPDVDGLTLEDIQGMETIGYMSRLMGDLLDSLFSDAPVSVEDGENIDPTEIEKLVCKFASNKMIEDRATAEVCELIEKEFPSMKFNPDCKTVVEAAWDSAVALCPPSDHEDENIDPTEIEKLVCKYASNKMIEDKATGEVCELIEKEFPSMKFDPDCKTVIEGAWDSAVALCPPSSEEGENIDPTEIEKLVCKYASNKMIEDKATGEVCELIEKEFPSMKFNPDCKTVVEAAWDSAVALCPPSSEEGDAQEEIAEPLAPVIMDDAEAYTVLE